MCFRKRSMSNDKDNIGEQNKVKINCNSIMLFPWWFRNSQVLSRLYPNWYYTATDFWRVLNLGNCRFNQAYHRLIEGF